MMVKNIVFDIGNVLLKWRPVDIVIKNFPSVLDPSVLAHKIFDSYIWKDLNLGKITEEDAVKLYYNNLEAVSVQQLTNLMTTVKESLTPVEGSIELLNDIQNLAIPLYSVTDNVKEIMSFIRQKYSFLNSFIDIIVSAEIGVLKPSQTIYMYLINKYQLVPEETVFIDDLHQNVLGAKSVGMRGIHFTSASDCRVKLKQLGIQL